MAASARLLIGAATVDITPPLGVLLAGYGPRQGTASEVGHPLRAEALVCRDEGDNAWALLTSDVIGYPYDMVQRIRREVALQVPLKPEAIMISGTHTHSGPSALSTYNEKLGETDHAYRREFEAKVARVLVDAFRAARPGSFEAVRTQAPDLAHNRRVIDDALNTCENVWLDERGEHTGYFDPTVMVVAVRREDGRRDVVLVNYGCHPVTLGPRSLAISADYPGYLKDALESRQPGLTTMFALAGAGNINPRLCIQVGAEYPKQMGEALANVVQDALAALKPLHSGPVAAARQPWSFTSCRAWPDASPRKKGQPLETEVQVLRVGDLAMISLPGELFSQYAAMLRKISPFPATVVVSLANDSTGYLPVDEALPQGGHEVVHRSAVEGIERSLMATAAKAFAHITA